MRSEDACGPGLPDRDFPGRQIRVSQARRISAMPKSKLVNFLDSHQVKYVIITHSTAYTASEIAASAHIKGKELAKTVIVKIDGGFAMAVLPASFQVDFELLKRATGQNAVTLAREDEFKEKFPDCPVGAMPPFGNLYDMKVFVAERLTEDEEIAFNAGSHTELIKMAYRDFDRLVQPQVIKFSAQ